MAGPNSCQFGSLYNGVYAKEGIVVYSKGRYLNDVYTGRGAGGNPSADVVREVA